MRTALAVMARYPAVGAVKTRLARGIGPERACLLYRAFLQDIEARFARRQRALVWMYYPPACDFAGVVGAAASCRPQEGADLGERMLNGFRTLLREGFERVIMIGADVPHVRDEWLDEAEEQLKNVDVVLGPTEDGGYYLVAMHSAHDVFSGVTMGRHTVLSDTLEIAAARKLTVHQLPRSFDVDELQSLQRLQVALEEESLRAALAQTVRLLDEWSTPRTRSQR